jgi:hypothetical protein
MFYAALFPFFQVNIRFESQRARLNIFPRKKEDSLNVLN